MDSASPGAGAFPNRCPTPSAWPSASLSLRPGRAQDFLVTSSADLSSAAATGSAGPSYASSQQGRPAGISRR